MHSGASALSMAVGCMLADVETVVHAARSVGWRCEMASTVYRCIGRAKVESVWSCPCACVDLVRMFEVLYASFLVVP